jgi:hypothetical protein
VNDKRAHRQLTVFDLPHGWLIALTVTQGVIGGLLGVVLAKTLQRIFISAYASVNGPRR